MLQVSPAYYRYASVHDVESMARPQFGYQTFRRADRVEEFVPAPGYAWVWPNALEAKLQWPELPSSSAETKRAYVPTTEAVRHAVEWITREHKLDVTVVMEADRSTPINWRNFVTRFVWIVHASVLVDMKWKRWIHAGYGWTGSDLADYWYVEGFWGADKPDAKGAVRFTPVPWHSFRHFARPKSIEAQSLMLQAFHMRLLNPDMPDWLVEQATIRPSDDYPERLAYTKFVVQVSASQGRASPLTAPTPTSAQMPSLVPISSTAPRTQAEKVIEPEPVVVSTTRQREQLRALKQHVQEKRDILLWDVAAPETMVEYQAVRTNDMDAEDRTWHIEHASRIDVCVFDKAVDGV